MRATAHQQHEATLRTLERDSLPFMVKHYGEASTQAAAVRRLIAKTKGVRPTAL